MPAGIESNEPARGHTFRVSGLPGPRQQGASMKKYIGVAATLTLAGWFVAGAAKAQVVPTESDIRLWEQEGSTVAPIERRLYSTHFDAVD
jgi:hypothetical protein